MKMMRMKIFRAVRRRKTDTCVECQKPLTEELGITQL